MYSVWFVNYLNLMSINPRCACSVLKAVIGLYAYGIYRCVLSVCVGGNHRCTKCTNVFVGHHSGFVGSCFHYSVH